MCYPRLLMFIAAVPRTMVRQQLVRIIRCHLAQRS